MMQTLGFYLSGSAAPAELFVIIFLGLLVLIFEITMFVNMLCNKTLTTSAKLLWGLGMLLVHPIIAIVYYFTAYRKIEK